MTRRSYIAAIAFVCWLPSRSSLAEQRPLPPAPHSARVVVTAAPTLELAHHGIAILRWTVTNPGGTDSHFGIVRYGTDPAHLDRTARSPVQMNRQHSEATFRVRLSGLVPHTTYYYRVSSTESTGRDDGVSTAVQQFTMPATGARFVAAAQTLYQPSK